jgi:hypothetical protein
MNLSPLTLDSHSPLRWQRVRGVFRYHAVQDLPGLTTGSRCNTHDCGGQFEEEYAFLWGFFCHSFTLTSGKHTSKRFIFIDGLIFTWKGMTTVDLSKSLFFF